MRCGTLTQHRIVEDHNLPLVFDPGLAVVQTALSSAISASGHRYALSRIVEIINRIGLQSAGERLLEARIANDVFVQAIASVEEELATWATRYSGPRWLWLLRRVPEHVFEGTVPTTSGYDTALAETVSGRSSRQTAEHASCNGQVSFSVDREVLTWLARFCAGVRLLSHIHVMYRWSAKGAAFRFTRGAMPTNEASDELATAVHRYDQRVASENSPLRRLGTPIAERVSRFDIGDITLLHPAKNPTYVACPRPGQAAEEEGVDLCRVLARFVPSQVSIQKLFRLVEDPRTLDGWTLPAETASLLCLAGATMVLAHRHSSGIHGLLATGYLAWADIRRAQTGLQDAIEAFTSQPLGAMLRATGIQDGADVFRHLHAIEGSAWPLRPGPVIRKSRSTVWIDYVAATQQLEAALQMPNIQGPAANARAAHFEDEVQAVIDASKWRPSEAMKGLRGKTLRLAGQSITDVDAVAHCPHGRFILVSCKSSPYCDAYDIGSHSVVRNADTRLVAAINALDNVLEILTRNPRGDNYDLRNFSGIIGFVCTSNVVFSLDPIASRELAPGLPVASSLGELERWLKTHGDNGVASSP